MLDINSIKIQINKILEAGKVDDLERRAFINQIEVNGSEVKANGVSLSFRRRGATSNAEHVIEAELKATAKASGVTDIREIPSVESDSEKITIDIGGTMLSAAAGRAELIISRSKADLIRHELDSTGKEELTYISGPHKDKSNVIEI